MASVSGHAVVDSRWPAEIEHTACANPSQVTEVCTRFLLKSICCIQWFFGARGLILSYCRTTVSILVHPHMTLTNITEIKGKKNHSFPDSVYYLCALKTSLPKEHCFSLGRCRREMTPFQML